MKVDVTSDSEMDRPRADVATFAADPDNAHPAAAKRSKHG